MDEVRNAFAKERHAEIKTIVGEIPALRHRKGLDRFWFEPLSSVDKHNPLIAVDRFLAEFAPTMERPILHLYGGSGSGKTHLALGLAAYAMLNLWGQPTDKDQDQLVAMIHNYYSTFANVDWINVVARDLDTDPMPIFHTDADLMIIDGLDVLHPVPKSGHPFRHETLLSLVKSRLETRKPTIITTELPYPDLIAFLASKKGGEVESESSDCYRLSARVVHVLAEHTLITGQLPRQNMRDLAMTDPNTYTELEQLAKAQDLKSYLPTTTPFGLPANY